MTTAGNTLAMIVATLVMLVAGIWKKRLEWRRRDGTWLHKRKPPTTGRSADT